ncbi:Ribonuclease III domain containing protein [Amanita muscaria]
MSPVQLQRRFASKLVSVSARFPPKDALFVRSDVPKPPFSPETWNVLQPAPHSALNAFVHRIRLQNVFSSPALVQQACTHSSFLSLFCQQYPNAPLPQTNAQLASIGNSLMGLFATEYLHAAYPYLPTRVLKAAVTAYVGPLTCAAVAQEIGAAPLLRWHRSPPSPTRPAILRTDALASISRALTALVYQERSVLSARQFVQSYFLSRDVDLRGMIKFNNPKKALLEMVNKFGREMPKSRLLAETGRFSNSPVYVVGIYSGADKLGEGFGSSLKMAEFRAAEDALHRVYLTRTPDHLLQLPSGTFAPGIGDVFRNSEEKEEHTYVAPQLATPEIMYASSGKSTVAPELAPRTLRRSGTDQDKVI